MDKYFRTYKYRAKEILIAFLSVVLSFVLCSVLFGDKINKISSQLEAYSSSEYNYIYLFNYPANMGNEYIYPDTSIMLYLNPEQTERVASTILMQEEKCIYDISIMNCANNLGANELSISRNLAQNYNLEVGSIIYASYPHTVELSEMKVVSIMNTNYDFENPDIDNDIGIAVIGYNDEYYLNTNNKAVCFSKDSLKSEIASHQQLLDHMINKSSNYESVFRQGVHVFIFESIFVLAAMIIAELFFFSRSIPRIKRIYLKGISKNKQVTIPLFEHCLLCILPAIITAVTVLRFIVINSNYTIAYYSIYILIIIIFVTVIIVNQYRRIHFSVR